MSGSVKHPGVKKAIGIFNPIILLPTKVKPQMNKNKCIVIPIFNAIGLSNRSIRYL